MTTSVAKTIAVAALFAIGLSGVAAARDQVITARLAAPLAQPTRVIAQDTLWSCEGDTCRAVSHHDANVRECRQFVRHLGQAVTSYGAEGQQLAADELERCNSDAPQQQARN